MIDWKLESRLKIKEELPPIGMPGKGGVLRTYLRRKPVWQSLVIEAKEHGEELTPYTFRHRYAKASHARPAGSRRKRKTLVNIKYEGKHSGSVSTAAKV